MGNEAEDYDPSVEARGLPVTEYARATVAFFSDAHEALLIANAPLVGRMPRQTVEALPTTRYVFESEVLDTHSARLEATLTMRLDNVRNFDIDEFVATIAEAASSMASQLQRQLLDNIDRLTSATGQRVDGSDRDPIDAIIDMMEVLEMSIDDDGHLVLPTIVMHPDNRLPQPTQEQLDRLNEVLRKKEEQAHARRPGRRLHRRRYRA